MCLLTTQAETLTATKAKTCYKTAFLTPTGNGDEIFFKSTIEGFHYDLGKTYELDEDKAQRFDAKNSWQKMISIGYGFHSYVHLRNAKDEAIDSIDEIILKCEIPVGAHYWKGKGSMTFDDEYQQQYCSDKIKVVAWRRKTERKWKTVQRGESKKTNYFIATVKPVSGSRYAN